MRKTTTHKEVASFYDEVYYAHADAAGRPNHHLRRLADTLTPQTLPARALDIACGAGAWLRLLAERGYSPSGIDISEKAISMARAAMPNGDFHVGPAEELPYPQATFDLVTCMGSLEHFLDQPKALRDMVRVAKPDARVLILVPNAGFPPHRLGLYGGTHQTAIKETIRPLDQWREMIEQAGLEIQGRRKDLHILNWNWITRNGPLTAVPRLAIAAALPLFPLSWQYQVYFDCRIAPHA